MPAQRFRVLLVDPVKIRRDRAAEATRLQFDIVGVGTAEEAAGVIGVVHAVVLTLKQADDNGLVVGRRLREKFGEAPYFLVHGATVPAKTTEERLALAARHNVDLWVANPIEPVGLEAALWGELNRRFRKREPAAAAAAGGGGNEPTWGQLLAAPVTVDNVKKMLTKDLGGKRKP